MITVKILVDNKEIESIDLNDGNHKGDLISRQSVIAGLEKWDWQDLYLPSHFKQLLDDIPSVKNKGEWISQYDEDGKTGWYECSCCHSERAFNTNFCPDCGADMRPEPYKGESEE